MSHGPGQRPVPPSSKEPRARFNWPPTEDDFAEYREEQPQTGTKVEEAAIQADHPPPADGPPPTDALDLFSSEALGAPFTVPGEPDAGDFEDWEPEASLPSAIDVSPTVDARHVEASTGLAAEIAQLQTLIEALTRKIDWRIPGDHP